MADELFDHQRSGGQWLATKERAGLFDKMGFGKTATAVHGLDLVGAKRGLVITTASSLENWKRAFRMWGTIPRRVRKGADKSDLATWLHQDVDVLIISYRIATTWAFHIQQRLRWFIDFAILDEAHNLKNKEAERTRAILGPDAHGGGGAIQWALRSWWLTGTPVANDPIDSWTFMTFARETTLPILNYQNHFMTTRTTAGGSSRNRVQPEKLQEMARMLQRSSIMRTEGLDIPPIHLTQTFLNGDTSQVEQYIRDHPGVDEAILRALKLGNLNLIDAQHIMTLQRLIGEAKALPFAAQLIDAFRGGLDKAVVFANHTKVLDLVGGKLTDARIPWVRIDGSVSQARRVLAVDTFQETDCPVFLGNIKAAGESITLTAANHLFMLESSWTPKDNAQPPMRISRIGQHRVTYVKFVTLADSLDEQIIDVVREKTRNIVEMTGHNLLTSPT